MAWSYRKRIKIIPGVHLNISKSGISTSIGVKGANVTFSNKGTYLNTSIPGLGISNRQKISGNNSSRPSYETPVPITYEGKGNIFSLDVQEITSQDMMGVKEAIISARFQRLELIEDLSKIKTSLNWSKVKLVLGYVFIMGLIKKEIANSIKEDIKEKKDAIVEVTNQIQKCYIHLNAEFDSEIKARYDEFVGSFKNLCSSRKIWDVTSAYYQNRVVTRSAASTTVSRREVRFGIRNIEDIKSDLEVLCFHNANGADIYFYPTFIVMHNSRDFAIIGFNELNLVHSPVRFVEEDPIPSDSNVIDKTWAKVNKNGSPDRRFKNNYQIPIVKYGQINLSTSTGVNEEYKFSNYEYSEIFADVFKKYQYTLREIKQLEGNYYQY